MAHSAQLLPVQGRRGRVRVTLSTDGLSICGKLASVLESAKADSRCLIIEIIHVKQDILLVVVVLIDW